MLKLAEADWLHWDPSPERMDKVIEVAASTAAMTFPGPRGLPFRQR